jgi:hypothetical protein
VQAKPSDPIFLLIIQMEAPVMAAPVMAVALLVIECNETSQSSISSGLELEDLTICDCDSCDNCDTQME